jgi:hypothetical protein
VGNRAKGYQYIANDSYITDDVIYTFKQREFQFNLPSAFLMIPFPLLTVNLLHKAVVMAVAN